MDRTEIDSLIKSVSEHGTLATAKEFFQNLQSVLTGEKFSGLPANKKLLLTVALAIEYGRKKAVELITGIKNDDVREATPEEIREMWELFYSKPPEEREAAIFLMEKLFCDIIPGDILEELKKRVNEKGFI